MRLRTRRWRKGRSAPNQAPSLGPGPKKEFCKLNYVVIIGRLIDYLKMKLVRFCHKSYLGKIAVFFIEDVEVFSCHPAFEAKL